jgi:hypothetical protein
MVNVTLVVHIFRMHFDDAPANVPCFRVPGHVIANLGQRGDVGALLDRHAP